MNQKLYETVFNKVIQRVVDGTYPPGAMLPSEQDLGAELSVSQGTARKALAELEQKGIIERRQGKGSFVTLRTPESSLFHFFRLRNADGEQVTPKLETETVSRRKSTARERQTLFGAPEHVFEIRRTRSYLGAPLCDEVSVVSSVLFPGLMERSPLPNALYVLFQQAYSCIIIRAEENLTADLSTPDIAKHLGIAVGQPVMTARRKSYDLLDRIVELRSTTFSTHDKTYFVSLK